jgi:hypothetical protein
MRVEGIAELGFGHPSLEKHPEAQLLVLVRVDAIDPSCGRYVHRPASGVLDPRGCPSGHGPLDSRDPSQIAAS